MLISSPTKISTVFFNSVVLGIPTFIPNYVAMVFNVSLIDAII